MTPIFNVVEEIQTKLNSDPQLPGKKENSISFESLIEQVKEHFDDFFKDDSNDSKKKQSRLNLYHKAVIGDKETEILLTNEIDSYLRSININNVPYPEYYQSLAQALFHEIYRFGILQKWYVMKDSPAAKFTGNEFWIEKNDVFEKQKEVLPHKDSVREFIQRFMAGQKNLKVNESNPYAEIALADQTRVTIIIPPANYEPTLIFRKYVVKNLNFEEQAERGTIPESDVDFYKVFSRLYFNTIVAGHIKSGKSTFLKSIYGAREPEKVAVLIEDKAETFLKQDFPNRLVHELYTHNQDINQTIRRALRIDHDFLIVQEVRGIEAEGAIGGTERGRNGLLMSYHITDPENTSIQLSQHIVDEYPNRHQVNEIRRISKSLDIGVTMESKNGRKRITSMYELGIDKTSNQPFINYLIYFNPKMNKWEYNSDVSNELIDKMNNTNSDLANKFIRHLQEQAKTNPMSIKARYLISLGSFRED